MYVWEIVVIFFLIKPFSLRNMNKEDVEVVECTNIKVFFITLSIHKRKYKTCFLDGMKYLNTFLDSSLKLKVQVIEMMLLQNNQE